MKTIKRWKRNSLVAYHINDSSVRAAEILGKKDSMTCHLNELSNESGLEVPVTDFKSLYP